MGVVFGVDFLFSKRKQLGGIREHVEWVDRGSDLLLGQTLIRALIFETLYKPIRVLDFLYTWVFHKCHTITHYVSLVVFVRNNNGMHFLNQRTTP